MSAAAAAAPTASAGGPLSVSPVAAPSHRSAAARHLGKLRTDWWGMYTTPQRQGAPKTQRSVFAAHQGGLSLSSAVAANQRAEAAEAIAPNGLTC